jgi:hypothetical protein
MEVSSGAVAVGHQWLLAKGLTDIRSYSVLVALASACHVSKCPAIVS